MRATLLRSIAFAAAVAGISLTIDLLVTAYHQGSPVLVGGRQFWMFRAALHGATLAFTAVGAAVGFALLRSYSITSARIVSLGAAWGLLTSVAAALAIRAGAYWGITAWLLFGAGLVSYFGGRRLAKKKAP